MDDRRTATNAGFVKSEAHFVRQSAVSPRASQLESHFTDGSLSNGGPLQSLTALVAPSAAAHAGETLRAVGEVGLVDGGPKTAAHVESPRFERVGCDGEVFPRASRSYRDLKS